ncbi:hypothetical protein JD844_000753 [Phrynosoma platyrhinos]|uniref:Hexosyltransferase n=1 Tax=Phrynosoma platyrhinos TaxID=52577 RepID=A0ABQ7T8J6_PHRPL|nr:hypothetical protein JD844_000753 [Phrynosoma platyrhinos]
MALGWWKPQWPTGSFLYCRNQRSFRICLLVSGVAILLYAFHYYLKPHRSISFTDANLTFVLDWDLHEYFYPQLQHYQCRELVSQDGLCQGEIPGGRPLLLLAIKSHPASNSRRAILRHTWAQSREAGGFQLKYVFLMAISPDARHANLVQQETDAIGDILMWDFVESHHNLSLKERCFLQWLHQHCQQAAYVFKGDDDLFVNIEALTEYLNQTPSVSEFIHGYIQYYSKVVRQGKYAVPLDFYPMRWYPNFASGGGFIMSRSSFSKLYKASLWLPVFPLDDVYLAFLALATGLEYWHEERFRVWGPPEDILEVYQDSLTVHGISMDRIQEVWKQLQISRKQSQDSIKLSTQSEPLVVCSDGSMPEV